MDTSGASFPFKHISCTIPYWWSCTLVRHGPNQIILTSFHIWLNNRMFYCSIKTSVLNSLEDGVINSQNWNLLPSTSPYPLTLLEYHQLSKYNYFDAKTDLFLRIFVTVRWSIFDIHLILINFHLNFYDSKVEVWAGLSPSLCQFYKLWGAWCQEIFTESDFRFSYGVLLMAIRPQCLFCNPPQI